MQCRDAWPFPLFILFLIYSSQERYKSSRIAALVRGSSPCRALRCARGGGGGDDYGDYVDLLITRFSLAFGRHAKIAFTALWGPDPWPRRATPYHSCRWHDQFFARARSEHSFSCVVNIRRLLFSVLHSGLLYVCPRRHPAAAIAAAIATDIAAAVIVSAIASLRIVWRSMWTKEFTRKPTRKMVYQLPSEKMRDI